MGVDHPDPSQHQQRRATVLILPRGTTPGLANPCRAPAPHRQLPDPGGDPHHARLPSRYFTTLAPTPWTRSGTSRVTVRTGGAYDVYLCVGNKRVPVSTNQAWALLAALHQALPASFGPAPAWLPTDPEQEVTP